MTIETKPKNQFVNTSKCKQMNNLKNDIYKHPLSENTVPTPVIITETDDTYHFELKKPGYIKEDFNFYIRNDKLLITTEKIGEMSANETSNNKTSRHSYCYPSAFFKKEFDLPNDIAKDKILVDYKDGILSFELLKSKKLN